MPQTYAVSAHLLPNVLPKVALDRTKYRLTLAVTREDDGYLSEEEVAEIRAALAPMRAPSAPSPAAPKRQAQTTTTRTKRAAAPSRRRAAPGNWWP